MAVQCAARLCFSSMVDMTWRSMAAAVSVTTRSRSPICIDHLLEATQSLSQCSGGDRCELKWL